MRLIRLIGEINEAAYIRVSEELAALEAKSTGPIILEIASEGGEDYTALALYGRLRNSPCKITAHAYGFIFSAATLIFAGCDYRKMDSECIFMVHDSYDKARGSVDQIKSHVKLMDRLEDQWAKLLEKHSNTTAEAWRDMSKRTTFLGAQNCYQLGIVDQILKGVKK